MKNKRVSVDLSKSGINSLIKEVNDYDKWIKEKSNELAQRLASLGATNASLLFSRAVYTGPSTTEMTVEQREDNVYVVRASGEEVLFIEFGSGITYGYGHPDVMEYGPGTYPSGKGHWDDPKGWYLPKEKGGQHTYGNPPNAVMYNTVKSLEEEILNVVREVFSS